MGAFIKTDFFCYVIFRIKLFGLITVNVLIFLLVDRFGFSKLVIKYQGSGHNLSKDTGNCMKIKQTLLYRVLYLC